MTDEQNERPDAPPSDDRQADAPSTRTSIADGASDPSEALRAAIKVIEAVLEVIDFEAERFEGLETHQKWGRSDWPRIAKWQREAIAHQQGAAVEIRRLRADLDAALDEARSLRSDLEAARRGDHDHDGSLAYWLARMADSSPDHGDLMRQAAREVGARQAEARMLRARVDALEEENGALKDQVEELDEELDECRAMDKVSDGEDDD